MMTFLYLNLVIVFILSFFARYFSEPVFAGESSVPIKPNKILMTGVLASLTIISGLRANIGDTFFYKHIYEINDFTWEFILSQKDIGFGILQMLLKEISDDPQIMVFTTAVITNVLIIAVFLNYSRMIELSVYVYITGGLFLVSMNGIRQVLAAAIIFAATKYLIEGNWIKYFFIVLLASTFHQSALILIPIYFFVRFKAWSKATLVLLAFSLLIVVGYHQFSSLLFAAIEDSQYGHYSNFDEGGANILRVVVDATPLFIAYLGREKLRSIFPSSDYIVNMAIVGFMFMIISTQNWIFARFGIYFTLYQLILISWIVKLFNQKDQRLIYYALLICYFLYYFFESVISLKIVYRSDYFGS